MENDKVTRISPEKVEAVYGAYALAMTLAGVSMPLTMDTLGQEVHERWWKVCNSIDEVAAPPTDVTPPYEYELSTPIEPIKISARFRNEDGSAVVPVGDDILMEDLPTSLSIRPFVTGDLCIPEYNTDTETLNLAMRARVHGVDVEMLEWRIDAADAEAAHVLIHEAGGTEAWKVMRQVFIEAGGEDHGDDIAGWRSAAYALLSEDKGEFMVVRTKTANLGTLQVGPIKAGHERLHSTVSASRTEWDGRLAALEKLVGSPLRGARVEDTDRLWTAYQVLAKKKERRASELVVARLSSLSTDGPGTTSEISPSPS